MGRAAADAGRHAARAASGAPRRAPLVARPGARGAWRATDRFVAVSAGPRLARAKAASPVITRLRHRAGRKAERPQLLRHGALLRSGCLAPLRLPGAHPSSLEASNPQAPQAPQASRPCRARQGAAEDVGGEELGERLADRPLKVALVKGQVEQRQNHGEGVEVAEGAPGGVDGGAGEAVVGVDHVREPPVGGGAAADPVGDGEGVGA